MTLRTSGTWWSAFIIPALIIPVSAPLGLAILAVMALITVLA